MVTEVFALTKGTGSGERLAKKKCCRRAYLRGAFLARGSISDPKVAYHLELTETDLYHAREVFRLVKSFKLHPRLIKRRGGFVIYLKECDNVVDFLNIIGAHGALLEIENIRIVKGMRNDANRAVNCDTANLDKTIDASLKHIENIKYIVNTVGLDKLPKALRQIAEARVNNSDSTLKELGEMLVPILGKSGVNYRLNKIDALVEDMKRKGAKNDT